MRTTVFWVAAIVLLMMPVVGSEDMASPDVKRDATGGHAVLMEHYTATWCESCADVDPWISDFTSDYSGRLYRVALHPNDHDPFGMPATQHRIFMKDGSADSPLPTIWFDGGNKVQGFVTYSELSNSLSSAEIGRGNGHTIGMEWLTWENGIDDKVQRVNVLFDTDVPVNSTLTLFRTETLEHDSEIASNGILIHHDVATAMFTVGLNGEPIQLHPSNDTAEIWQQSNTAYTNSVGFDSVINFELNGDADSFVAVFENEGEVLAVLGISDVVHNPSNQGKNTVSAIFILAGALVLSSILLYRKQ